MRALLLLLALALPAKAAELTPEEMRAFGQAAVLQGYADQALAVSAALLARDQADAGALVIRAQALRLLGRLPESEAAARAAWRADRTPALRYAAATALAQALSLQGRRGAAQFWLRRAVDVAPSVAAGRQALADLRYVRGENPLRLRFDLSLRPSDNVNGGTRTESFDLLGVSFPVPPELTALSGLTWGLGMEGAWRFAADPRGETALTFAASRSGAVLSQVSKEAAPLARNGSYDFWHLGLGLERESRTGTVLAFDLGRNWYGGQALSTTYGLRAGMDFRQTGVTAALTREIRADRKGADSTRIDLGLDHALRGPGGDLWRAGLDLGRALSEDPTVDRREARLTLTWEGKEALAGLGLAAQLGLGGAEYGSGRAEGRLSASLEAQLDAMAWAGFAPVISLSWARTNSNRLINDSDSLGLGLSVRSQF